MTTSVDQAVEIIRLKVAPASFTEFLAKREAADQAVSRLKGFISSELCRQGEEDWVMFIRWENMEVVKEAQKITENMPEITAWIAVSSQFISFDTVEVKRYFGLH